MGSQKAAAADGHSEHSHHSHDAEVKIENIEVESPETWQRVLSVSLPGAEWQAARARVLVGLRRKVQLPGFRKGKAPKDMVESQFAHQIDMDALEWLLPRAWHQVLHEVELNPVDEPEFSDIDFGKKGDAFRFKATIEVRPEIEISGYDGINVTWYQEKEPSEGVERTLDAIREGHAEFVEVEREAKAGDRLTVDFRQVETSGVPIVGTEVKGHIFELGSEMVLADFSAGVDGIKPGEERRFPVSYPEDYEQRTLAGETRHFQVTADKVEEKNLPELNDEFAAKIGKFENMEQVREQIARNIKAEVEQRNARRLDTALVQALLAVNEFSVPPAMVKRYADHLIADQEREQGQTLPEEERASAQERLKPGAEFALKRWFLLDAVAEQEKIVISDEDFEEHLKALAAAEGGELEDIRRSVERARAEDRMREDLMHRKTFEFLKGKAKIKEEDIPENLEGTGATR